MMIDMHLQDLAEVIRLRWGILWGVVRCTHLCVVRGIIGTIICLKKYGFQEMSLFLPGIVGKGSSVIGIHIRAHPDGVRVSLGEGLIFLHGVMKAKVLVLAAIKDGAFRAAGEMNSYLFLGIALLQ